MGFSIENDSLNIGCVKLKHFLNGKNGLKNRKSFSTEEILKISKEYKLCSMLTGVYYNFLNK